MDFLYSKPLEKSTKEFIHLMCANQDVANQVRAVVVSGEILETGYPVLLAEQTMTLEIIVEKLKELNHKRPRMRKTLQNHYSLLVI